MAIINNTLSDHLTYLEETKEQIKQALIDKGQQIDDTKPFRGYVDNINNLGTAQLYNNIDEMNNTTKVIPNGTFGIVYDINSSNFQGLYYYNKNKYEPAKTQFKAVDEDVMNVAYYGKNGVSVGNLNSIKYIDDKNIRDISNFCNKLYDLYNTLDMSNITTFTNLDYNLPYYRITNLQNCISFDRAFSAKYNLKIVEGLNNRGDETCNITTLKDMFNMCYNLRYVDFSKSNLHNTTTLQNCFNACYNLSTINFNSSNLAKVTNLSKFASDDTCLLEVDMNNTFLEAQDFSQAFSKCTNLQILRGVNNKFKQAVNLYRTFYNCYKLVDRIIIKNVNSISNIEDFATNSNLSLILNDIDLLNCNSSKNLGVIGGWFGMTNALAKDSDIINWFTNSNASHIELQNVLPSNNNCITVENLFANCKLASEICFRNPNNNHYHIPAISVANLFANCSNAEYLDCNYLIDLTNTVNFSHMYFNCYSMLRGNIYTKYNFVTTTEPIDVSYMYCNCQVLGREGYAPIYQGGLTKILTTGTATNTAYMAYNCYYMNSITAHENINLVNVTNAAYMYYNCRNLADTGYAKNIINLHKCVNTSSMFYYCHNLNLNLFNMTNFINVENAANMFAFANLSTESSDTYYIPYMPKVKDVSSMYRALNNPNLTVIWENFQTNNAFSSSYMLANCDLNTLIFKDINVNNSSTGGDILHWSRINHFHIINSTLLCWKTTIPFVWANNVNFTDVNLPYISWTDFGDDLSFGNIEYRIFNNVYMQGNDIKAVIDNYDIKYIYFNNIHAEITEAAGLFKSHWGTHTIDLGDLNFGLCKNMDDMYYYCPNLINIYNINNLDFSNCSGLNNMFTNCSSLRNINIDNWKVPNVISINNLFYNCKNLSNNSIDSIINMCLNLTNLGSDYKNIHNSIFVKCDIDNTRYENRWEELTAAGWTY